MKILLIIVLTLPVLVYSQFNGICQQGALYNIENHFLFSSSSDTIVNGSWAQLANYPKQLFGVNSYYWPAKGKIFLCGGADSTGAPQKSCYFYNPVSNSYESADSLPMARWTGKLVRVKDSLYLVGSVNNFGSPDGVIYKYSPSLNQWVIKDTMPIPYVHESAVCVFRDSLIICIGGSSASFQQPVNLVRAYNPAFNLWKNITSFPVTVTTAHAECNSTDSSIVLVGGSTPSFNNIIYRGRISFYDTTRTSDSILINWHAVAINDSTVFHTGVYRVSGGIAKDWMIFGPALRNSSTYNTIYSVKFIGDSIMYWYRCIPNVPDSAGNRSLAVYQFDDSAYVYLFAGSVGLTTVRSSYKYSFALPVPIGIKPISGIIPKDFMLYQNYPNPFNPISKIKFSIGIPSGQISKLSEVKLMIYDILGREIQTLVNEQLQPGTYEAEWDAAGFSSGIYFYSLIADGELKSSKKMMLIK